MGQFKTFIEIEYYLKSENKAGRPKIDDNIRSEY